MKTLNLSTMKKSFLLLILICFNMTLFSQNLDWVKTINSGGYAVTNDVCVDDNNRQYSISYSGSSNSSYYNNISFNNNPTGTLGNIIIKTNPTGSSEWYNSFSGGGNCEPKKILYHNGYIYIAGILSGTSDMDPGPSVYNLYGYFPSPFIVKMDTLGNFIWAKSFGSNNGVGAVVNDLKVDNNQNVFITGSFNASFSFNGTLQTSNGNDDVYFLKFNNQGQEEWCKTFGSNSANSESGNSIAIDSNGDILIAGMYSGSVDFDAGPGDFTLTSIGIRSGFITKYNQNGNHINTVKIDGSNNTSESRIYSIDINNSSIYVAGSIYGTVDMDPGTLIFNETQLNSGFILKLDPQFNLIWNKIISTTGGSEGKIVKSKFNEVYLSGYMSGTTDLDPDPTNSLIYSGGGTYVVKLNENGNFIWGAGFINTSDPLTMNTYSYMNLTYGIAISNSAVYIVGGFTGPVDFNPDLSITQITQSTLNGNNIGLPSGFLVKLTNCTTNNTTTQINSCNSYLWTQTGQTYTNPGTYNDTLQNASGCDSIITLVLTITPSSTNTTTASACNSYAWNGTSYTASGVYSGTTTNCVTESLNLTITPSSTNTTSASACGSYVWNGTTYTSSGVYTGTTTNCVTQALNLTITPSSTNTTTVAACNNYAWNGQTYTQSGVYTGTTANCVTQVLNLTINTNTSSSISQTALDSYTWPVNSQTYTTTGAYTAVIPNAAGCDSTITLNLTMSFTGINDLSTSKLSVYPNPTNGDFTITGLGLLGTVSSLTLTDMNGKVVKVLDTKATKFSMASIKTGVYFLNILSGNKEEVLKIVKE
jgi:hypothetical protein